MSFFRNFEKQIPGKQEKKISSEVSTVKKWLEVSAIGFDKLWICRSK